MTDPLRPTTSGTMRSWADDDDEDDSLSDKEVNRLERKVDQTTLKDRLGPSATAKAFVPGATNAISPAKIAAVSNKATQDHDNLIKTTNEVRVKLADLQADPESPLYSAKSFEDLPLHDTLLKGLYAMRFQKPSKIQERALPLLLANPPRNMIGQSQSGTGKTAAFALTMLSRVDPTKTGVQALCIAPSRELARQIMDVVVEMGKYTQVKTAMALKDTIERGAKIDAHIVVGTPGTVMDIVKRGSLSTKDIQVLVLDEADNMLDKQGLGSQSLKIKSLCPKTTQIVLFSATFPAEVEGFAGKFAPSANEIRLKTEELSVDGIKQLYMDCPTEESKYDILCDLYGILTIGQSIIFVRRRDTADRVAKRMTDDGHQVVSLHGAKDGGERDTIMDDFRTGRKKVLITTNVIARGIDVLQVNMVVNYDMPTDAEGKPDPETYLHRIGRTGRFGRLGVSVNFVHDKRSFEEMKAIQDYLQRPMTRVPTDDLEELERVVKEVMKS
ncbi:RNA helicase required for poly(A+) mRNA export [Savitreella phatthalungensis]